ncbi:DinB family protein [Chitinophaga nivalis]|uniref:DinB family protein n=1 Tax=Chitinophaga nivalis TaxID=2991709 RepID=A0ABT3IMI9_9BACT|nr:DinB family protein [Chitinophaga nivalis]MCW3465364.1 DinB family protein [Chitinophaga nivalis]MCW3484944.1 DinB family protein [Chitinophaga nivalis]
MQLTEHLATSVENLYSGSPWIDVTFEEHLPRINARQAIQVIKESNCIWQIVNHIIYWHQRVQRYLYNEPPEQDGDLPDFYLPENHGEENWQATLHRLQHSFEQMAATIRKFPEDKLFETVPGTKQVAIYYLQGIAEHDAYHLGQIVLLHKYA